ncbi:CBASS cGAMP-activated phospholipase [Rhizobium leguminosarum]|uniref:CBASS cGAMP-activated phospholipase n=1 Tax=Rhizobium leguminosarum TaxID=384 RepID=UPI0021BC1752|nr:CBASS cGAMP-activated phospholipase [Rhizobium leguminosarum]
MNYIAPPRSDGTNHRGRQKQPWPKDRLFRILSVDGGGIRGIFPAAYLAEIENCFLNGKSVSSHFDMIAGTSTGGIVALGLAHGMTAKQVLEIYTERGQTIFPTPKGLGGLVKKLRFLTKPKHDHRVLKDELLRIFRGKVLDDAATRLVIPTFEAVHGEPYIYKTPHHPDYQLDRHKTFVDAALHTTAAPAYFAAVDNDGHIMIDGGVWANNPVMTALVDVIACYDVPLENIRILSLGTGEEGDIGGHPSPLQDGFSGPVEKRHRPGGSSHPEAQHNPHRRWRKRSADRVGRCRTVEERPSPAGTKMRQRAPAN